MAQLLDLSRKANMIPIETAVAFGKVRHGIGRLAQRIRAVQEVIEDADGNLMESLLEVFEVAVVPCYRSVSRPQADGHTNLNNILKRMLGAHETQRHSQLLHYLSDLDKQTRLEEKLRDQFDPDKSRPSVHAEVQMLHHFYDNNRYFFYRDAFIGTSKPACFCCKLYFRHHPASYDEPESHQKVYPNWGPIGLPRGKDDQGWLEHRMLMNKVIDDLCKEVLRELERRRAAPGSHYDEHPDTITALTTSSHTLGDDSSDSEDEFEGQELDDLSDFQSEDDSDADSEGGIHI